MYSLLLMVLFGGDVGRLGHLDYDTREAAEKRLRGWAVLAAPLLLEATRSESAEVRLRANRLLAAWRTREMDCRAVLILAGFVEPHPGDFFLDDLLRRYVHRAAIRAGAEDWRADYILPEYDSEWSWWDPIPPEMRLMERLRELRQSIGNAQP